MNTSHRAQLGCWAEQHSLQLLKAQGFDEVAQNYHSRYGEIDLIVRSTNTLVFAEVKARSVRAILPAHAVVSLSKQKKMAKTALFFLQNYPEYADYYCRFDVISFDFLQVFDNTVDIDFAKMNYELQWIENAFTFQEDLINL